MVVSSGSFRNPGHGTKVSIVATDKETAIDLCVRKLVQNALYVKSETDHATSTTDTGDTPSLDFPETFRLQYLSV